MALLFRARTWARPEIASHGRIQLVPTAARLRAPTIGSTLEKTDVVSLSARPTAGLAPRRGAVVSFGTSAVSNPTNPTAEDNPFFGGEGIPLLTPSGGAITAGEATTGRVVFCWEQAQSLLLARDQFAAAGYKLLVVAIGTPEGGRQFCSALPFPPELLLLDPDLRLYRHLSCAEGLKPMLIPEVWKAMKERKWEDFKAILQKYKPIRPKNLETTAVMGGVWVLDNGKAPLPQPSLLMRRRSPSAPSEAALLDEVLEQRRLWLTEELRATGATRLRSVRRGGVHHRGGLAVGRPADCRRGCGEAAGDGPDGTFPCGPHTEAPKPLRMVGVAHRVVLAVLARKAFQVRDEPSPPQLEDVTRDTRTIPSGHLQSTVQDAAAAFLWPFYDSACERERQHGHPGGGRTHLAGGATAGASHPQHHEVVPAGGCCTATVTRAPACMRRWLTSWEPAARFRRPPPPPRRRRRNADGAPAGGAWGTKAERAAQGRVLIVMWVRTDRMQAHRGRPTRHCRTPPGMTPDPSRKRFA
ncbi:hypothetical protein PLESTF_001536800 [Pleodorina starrii]|nr:hypothetical protein PLESTF_001536800 [Pleodorina starrii]